MTLYDRPVATPFPKTAPRRPAAGFWRALRRAGLALLVAVAAFGAGFGWFAEHIGTLTTPDVPQEADAIIVLTGGHARIDTAVDLLKTGKGKRLLISGVHPSAGRDALSAATGGDSQLFACCVDIDHAALDTIGNAEESAKWVTNHGYRRVILVTNNYHMPRSLLEMHRLIGGVELVPYPVVNTPLDGGAWMREPDTVRLLFTEYVKYLAAFARGALPGAPGEAEAPAVHALAR